MGRPLSPSTENCVALLNRDKPRIDTSLCVYNQTRESFLSLSIKTADTHLARLRGLLGRMQLRSDEGIWIVPSQGVHTIGVLFPIDVIYLDKENRVIHLVESLGTFRISPLRREAASVLEMKARTIYSSHTQVGDRLVICPPDELAACCAQQPGESVTR